MQDGSEAYPGAAWPERSEGNAQKRMETKISVKLPTDAVSGLVTVTRDGIVSNSINIYVKYAGFNLYPSKTSALMQPGETKELELVVAGFSTEVSLGITTDNEHLGAVLSTSTITPNGTADLTIQSGSLIENGTYYVTISGNSGTLTKTTEIEITVGDAFTITTEELAAGMQNTGYFGILKAANGESPVTWNLKGGELPSGISLSDTGTLSGRPVKTGTSSFTVEAEDSYGRLAEQVLSITIEENAWFKDGKDGGVSRYNPVPGPADDRSMWRWEGSPETASLENLISGDKYIFAWSTEKLTAFDAKTGMILYTIDGTIKKAVYSAGNLYVLKGTDLEVYDAPYGAFKWTRNGVSTFTTNATKLVVDEESGLSVLDMTGTLSEVLPGDLPEEGIIWFNGKPHYLNGSNLSALGDAGWETVYTADTGTLLEGSAEDGILYLAGDLRLT
ncbi:MAG: Ig domain-containing protein, partial [Spirochaetales bacterium]|nr:Ig domain-containing protein [Spirochaetales bacterium]